VLECIRYGFRHYSFEIPLDFDEHRKPYNSTPEIRPDLEMIRWLMASIASFIAASIILGVLLLDPQQKRRSHKVQTMRENEEQLVTLEEESGTSNGQREAQSSMNFTTIGSHPAFFRALEFFRNSRRHSSEEEVARVEDRPSPRFIRKLDDLGTRFEALHQDNVRNFENVHHRMSGALSAGRPTTRGQKQPPPQQQPSNRGRGGKHKQSRATGNNTTQDDMPATTNVVEFRYTIDNQSSRKQQTSNKRTLASEAFGRLANRQSNKTEGGQPVKRARIETTTTTNRHNDDIRRHQEQQQLVSPRQQQQQDRSRNPWHGDNFNRQPNANMKPVQVIINATQDSNYRERRGGRGGRGHHAMPPQPVEEEENPRYGKDPNYRGGRGRGGRGYTPTRPPEQQYYEAADEEPLTHSHLPTTYRGGQRGGRGGRGYIPPPQPVEEEEFFPVQHPPSNYRGGRGRGGRGYTPTRPPEQQYYEAAEDEPLPDIVIPPIAVDEEDIRNQLFHCLKKNSFPQ